MSARSSNPLLTGYQVHCPKCGTTHGSFLACPRPAPSPPEPALAGEQCAECPEMCSDEHSSEWGGWRNAAGVMVRVHKWCAESWMEKERRRAPAGDPAFSELLTAALRIGQTGEEALAARAAVEARHAEVLERFNLLSEAVNDFTPDECGAGCDSYGHDADCPRCDAAVWMQRQQATLNEQRSMVATLEARLAALTEAIGLVEESSLPAADPRYLVIAKSRIDALRSALGSQGGGT